MKNDLSQIIFYLNLKHVHKYGSAKFQPDPLFLHNKWAQNMLAEEKKKSLQPIGDPIGTGCPNP